MAQPVQVCSRDEFVRLVEDYSSRRCLSNHELDDTLRVTAAIRYAMSKRWNRMIVENTCGSRALLAVYMSDG